MTDPCKYCRAPSCEAAKRERKINMMPDPRDLVYEVLGYPTCGTPGPGGNMTISLPTATTVTLTQLKRLAHLFLTEDIEVDFEDGTDWGGDTGSDPGNIDIHICGIKRELAWRDGVVVRTLKNGVLA